MDYPKHKGSLLTMLHKYREVIGLRGKSLGATDKAKRHIILKPGAKPVYIPAYRLSHSQRRVVDEQVKDMLKQGVLQASRSTGNSPLFLVPKKDGQFRPVIDFRKFIEVPEEDR